MKPTPHRTLCIESRACRCLCRWCFDTERGMCKCKRCQHNKDILAGLSASAPTPTKIVEVRHPTARHRTSLAIDWQDTVFCRRCSRLVPAVRTVVDGGDEDFLTAIRHDRHEGGGTSTARCPGSDKLARRQPTAQEQVRMTLGDRDLAIAEAYMPKLEEPPQIIPAEMAEAAQLIADAIVNTEGSNCD